MAQERPVTPEKQLLNLIETSPAKAGGVEAHAIKRHGMSFLSPGAWMGRASFFKDNFRKRFKGDYSELLSIKVLNNILIVVIVLLTVYFAGTVYNSIINLTKMIGPKLAIQEAKEETAGAQNVSVLKNAMSYYLEKVRQRDIFKIGAQPAPQTKAVSKAPTPKIVEETQRLKLVGISWSKNPDAMIEDTVALRTFFVKRGQTIGRVKIEGIFKDKVILSFEGEEAELK